MSDDVSQLVNKVRSGKIIELDLNKTRHELIIGDCSQVLKELPKNSVDLIITDPPYNKGLDYGKYYKDRMAWDIFYKKSEAWLKESSKVLSLNGSLYIITYPEIAARYLIYLENSCNMKLRRWLTWHYPSNVGHSVNNFTRTQRTILFMVKNPKDYTFNKKFILQPYKNLDVGRIKNRIKEGHKGRGAYDLLTDNDITEITKMRSDVLHINLLKNVDKERFTVSKKDKKVGHPCQLPPQLLETLIQVSSKPNDIILDPFAGTFMTNKIAGKLNRHSIGIEINPNYIKFGKKRFRNG